MTADGADIDETALAIYQRHLDAVTDALLRGDYDTFGQYFVFPHYVVTLSDHFVIEDPQTQRVYFRQYYDALRTEGVTGLIRIARGARFKSDTVICGRHESHRMRHGLRVAPPYLNRVRLVRGSDGSWREYLAANALINRSGAFAFLSFEDGAPLPDLPTDFERKPK